MAGLTLTSSFILGNFWTWLRTWVDIRNIVLWSFDPNVTSNQYKIKFGLTGRNFSFLVSEGRRVRVIYYKCSAYIVYVYIIHSI